MARAVSTLEARRFLEVSKQFLFASERVEATQFLRDEFEQAIIPQVVCIAFSIELALKSIYFSENNKKIHGHDIFSLFEKLSEDSKNRIKNSVPVPAYPRYDPPRNFMDVLEDHKRAFEDWRYACEGKSDLYADIKFLRNLAEAIHVVAGRYLPVPVEC